jgi:hypothetical protein
MVSRFRRPAEVKQVLREFAEGKVDVLVGTHRILSRDVIPKELGLVSSTRSSASASPEGAPPRAAARGRRARAVGDADPAHAAHVALGPRDISVIETPPEGRGRSARRRRVRRRAVKSRSSGSTRAGGRRSTSITGSSRSTRPRRSCGSSAPACGSSQRTARCGARARGAHARVPRRRRGRPRLDDDHRVGDRHPAGEHADRRARRHARARAALPDPRSGRAART